MNLPKHDSPNSSTQDSVKPTNTPSRKPYDSGANVGSGKGPKPSEPAPAAQPKGKPW